MDEYIVSVNWLKIVKSKSRNVNLRVFIGSVKILQQRVTLNTLAEYTEPIGIAKMPQKLLMYEES